MCPPYQLHQWEKKIPEIYIFSNSYNKCSIFLSSILKTILRPHNSILRSTISKAWYSLAKQKNKDPQYVPNSCTNRKIFHPVFIYWVFADQSLFITELLDSEFGLNPQMSAQLGPGKHSNFATTAIITKPEEKIRDNISKSYLEDISHLRS